MSSISHIIFIFFFQAEDGIRDLTVTGVQTCALPISTKLKKNNFVLFDFGTRLNNYCSDMTRTIFFGKANKEQNNLYHAVLNAQLASKIGRASCRERV